MQTGNQQQDQHWRKEYRHYRYLEFATEGDLEQRFTDVLTNCYLVEADGKLRVRPDIDPWLRLFVHLREEVTLRNQGVTIPIPPRYPRAARAAELWKSLRIPDGSCLLKLGRREHIQRLHEQGMLRIAPAEAYEDAKLGKAIRDDERTFSQESVGATVQFPPGRNYRIPQDQWISTPIIGTLKMIGNYMGQAYMACFAQCYDFRLFDEFGYDACLVICDPMRFITTVRAAGERSLPGWDFYVAPVSYRDPFQPEREIDVLYTKHFRFAYQKELRMTWERLPQDGKEPLQPIFLDLGCLAEYCELLVL